MKLSILFVFLCITALMLSTKVSKNRQYQASNLHTQYNDWGNGSVYYLDRHYVHCPDNQALSYIKFNRPTPNKINYVFTCIRSDSITLPVNVQYTEWNQTNGDYSTNFLDRHNVQCPKNFALAGFQLERNEKNSSRIRYKFECIPIQSSCCKSKQTSFNDINNNESSYLDRHAMDVRDSLNNQVITGFKLNTKYAPNQIWYTYNYCVLKDAAAVNAVKQKAKEASNAGFKMATVQESFKNTKDTLNKLKFATEPMKIAFEKAEGEFKRVLSDYNIKKKSAEEAKAKLHDLQEEQNRNKKELNESQNLYSKILVNKSASDKDLKEAQAKNAHETAVYVSTGKAYEASKKK